MFKGGASDLTYYIFRPLFIPMKMFYAEGETLEKVIWLNGKPKNLRCDNGPEVIAKELQEWCKGNDIWLLYTQPGCPTQNSYIERFNGTNRRAILDAYIFRSIGEVREMTDEWTYYYNNERPHETLGVMPPMKYRKQYENNDD